MLRNIMTLQLNINAYTCNGTNFMGSCTGGHWFGFHSGVMLVLFGVQYNHLFLSEIDLSDCFVFHAFCVCLGGDLNS